MTKKDKEELIKSVAELKEKDKKMSKGAKQAMDIMSMYGTVFNDIQREAFLLGRISALLEFGNAVADSANESIKNCEEALEGVKARINENAEKEIKKTTRKPRSTTKKKENK